MATTPRVSPPAAGPACEPPPPEGRLNRLSRSMACRSRRRSTTGNDHGVPPRTPQRPSETVAADLRRRIAADEWAGDEALPTTAALAEHYGVSQATITR